jgi:hypothetical protein
MHMARRHNKTGRSTDGGRYVQLHHFLLKSAAWRALTPAERAVYLELAAIYNGANNGFLALSARDAAARCNINKDTATRCFRRLEELGFIDLVQPGGFTRKVRHAAEYRLTKLKCDRTGERPSNLFLKWTP